LRHLGLEPAHVPILAVKSSVHFRAAYEPVARAIINVAAPGDVRMDLAGLPYRRATRRPARGPAAHYDPVPEGGLT
jgi:microcystin degradation protein MlrC